MKRRSFRLSNLPYFHHEIISKIYIVALFALTFISCGSKAGYDKEKGYQKMEGMIWNTLYHITYKGSPTLQDSVMEVLNEVGGSLSVFDKNSLTSRLNNSDSISADRHLKKVYEESLRINRISKGSFDPTVAPLVDAWGFGLGHTPTADTLAIDSIREFVGIEKTLLRDGYIIKEDYRTRFNFSAIAKGYGCDAIGEMFHRNGTDDFMIEIGGEITLSGKSPSGRDWKIAVDAPVEGKNPGEDTALVISVTDVGVATSGNYRNYREDGATKRAHTISPLTGFPYLSEILSATVIAETCMEADAIATACMASTPEMAKELIDEARVEALLIFPDSVWTTSGFPADKN